MAVIIFQIESSSLNETGKWYLNLNFQIYLQGCKKMKVGCAVYA